MKKKNNPVRGFAGDLRLAIRLLPWLLLAYILLHGCIAPYPRPPPGRNTAGLARRSWTACGGKRLPGGLATGRKKRNQIPTPICCTQMIQFSDPEMKLYYRKAAYETGTGTGTRAGVGGAESIFAACTRMYVPAGSWPGTRASSGYALPDPLALFSSQPPLLRPRRGGGFS